MQAKKTFDVVIAGAGVCGLATAYHILRQAPRTSIAIVTSHPAMSLTSSVSTECYRDHWPNPYMRALMRRSIQLLRELEQESGAFKLDNRGYLYVTKNIQTAKSYLKEAESCHSSLSKVPASESYACAGASVHLGPENVRGRFGGFLSADICGAMYVHNAGWMPAHTMGMAMLDFIKSDRHSASVLHGRVSSLSMNATGSRVTAVEYTDVTGNTHHISCGAFVNASGPYLNSVHGCHFSPTGVKEKLPIINEVHAKAVLRDTAGVIPRDCSMVICSDPITLQWTDEEQQAIKSCLPTEFAHKITGNLGCGAHFRPYGGPTSDAVLLLWESWHDHIRPADDLPASVMDLLEPTYYPEVLLRGLSTVVPGLRVYYDDAYQSGNVVDRNRFRRPAVDGGYYTKTKENLPLIGHAPVCGQKMENSFVVGAVSGYGVMASHAAGELAALHVLGASKLPDYEDIMSPMRHHDLKLNEPGGVLDTIRREGGGQL